MYQKQKLAAHWALQATFLLIIQILSISASAAPYAVESRAAKQWIASSSLSDDHYCFYFGLHDEQKEVRHLCFNPKSLLNGVQSISLFRTGTITKVELFKAGKEEFLKLVALAGSGDLKITPSSKDCERIKKLISFDDMPQDLQVSELKKSMQKVYGQEFTQSEAEFSKKIIEPSKKHACYSFGFDEDVEYFGWTKETCFDAENKLHGIQIGSYQNEKFIYIESFDHGKPHGLRALIHTPSASVLSLVLYEQGQVVCEIETDYDFALKTFFKE